MNTDSVCTCVYAAAAGCLFFMPVGYDYYTCFTLTTIFGLVSFSEVSFSQKFSNFENSRPLYVVWSLLVSKCTTPVNGCLVYRFLLPTWSKKYNLLSCNCFIFLLCNWSLCCTCGSFLLGGSTTVV